MSHEILGKLEWEIMVSERIGSAGNRIIWVPYFEDIPIAPMSEYPRRADLQ